MFPGPGAQVYYNEAGEPLGWDYPSTEPPEIDDELQARTDAYAEEQWDLGYEMGEAHAEDDQDRWEEFPNTAFKAGYVDGYDTVLLNRRTEHGG